MLHNRKGVLVKIQTDAKLNHQEYKVCLKLNKFGREQCFPQIYGGGEFIIDCSASPGASLHSDQTSQKHSFIVMEKLGNSLFHYMKQSNFKFSLETVCKLGIRLIQILEQIHNIGMTYNDLKLENVLVGDADGSPNSLSNVRLVDFGLCSKYVDENGYHIAFGKTDEFVGNVAMCSINAL